MLMETGKSGPIDASRDGAADAEAEAANDGAFFDPFVLPVPFPTGAERDDPLPNLSSPSLAAVAIATANCDSLSPTHARANHRPPAIPRTSRCATRQWRTFLPLLSRGIVGAAPVFILGAGWTGKGFVGNGYSGIGTFSKLMVSSGVGIDGGGGGKCSKSNSGGLIGSMCVAIGDDAAVPVYSTIWSQYCLSVMVDKTKTNRLHLPAPHLQEEAEDVS